MKAIILAAGKGSRLYPLTLEKPKGLLKTGETTILDRLVHQFRENGIEDVLLVVGFQKDCMKDHFKDRVRYLEYNDYETTNNLHTLWSIKDELNEDVLITFADLVVDNEIIKKVIESKENVTMVVDTKQVLEGTMRVCVDNEKLVNITSTTVEEASGNFIGLSKISKSGCESLIDEMSKLVNGHKNDYYTIAIDRLARNGVRIGYFDVKDFIWREIDTKEDYDELLSIYNKIS